MKTYQLVLAGMVLTALVPLASADTDVTVHVTQDSIGCATFLDGTSVWTPPGSPVGAQVTYYDCVDVTASASLPVP